MPLVEILGIWVGFAGFNWNPAVVKAATEIPEAPARSVRLKVEENSLTVVSRVRGERGAGTSLYCSYGKREAP